MAKTAKEPNIIKEEVETLNKKLVELNDEELEQVSGGARFLKDYLVRDPVVIVENTIEAEGGIEAVLGLTPNEAN